MTKLIIQYIICNFKLYILFYPILANFETFGKYSILIYSMISSLFLVFSHFFSFFLMLTFTKSYYLCLNLFFFIKRWSQSYRKRGWLISKWVKPLVDGLFKNLLNIPSTRALPICLPTCPFLGILGLFFWTTF